MDLLETRVSSGKVDLITANLIFQFFHHAEAIGFFRGIWIVWKESIRVNVIRSHPNLF